jgi:hypothetical protein
MQILLIDCFELLNYYSKNPRFFFRFYRESCRDAGSEIKTCCQFVCHTNSDPCSYFCACSSLCVYNTIRANFNACALFCGCGFFCFIAIEILSDVDAQCQTVIIGSHCCFRHPDASVRLSIYPITCSGACTDSRSSRFDARNARVQCVARDDHHSEINGLVQYSSFDGTSQACCCHRGRFRLAGTYLTLFLFSVCIIRLAQLFLLYLQNATQQSGVKRAKKSAPVDKVESVDVVQPTSVRKRKTAAVSSQKNSPAEPKSAKIATPAAPTVSIPSTAAVEGAAPIQLQPFKHSAASNAVIAGGSPVPVGKYTTTSTTTSTSASSDNDLIAVAADALLEAEFAALQQARNEARAQLFAKPFVPPVHSQLYFVLCSYRLMLMFCFLFRFQCSLESLQLPIWWPRFYQSLNPPNLSLMSRRSQCRKPQGFLRFRFRPPLIRLKVQLLLKPTTRMRFLLLLLLLLLRCSRFSLRAQPALLPAPSLHRNQTPSRLNLQARLCLAASQPLQLMPVPSPLRRQCFPISILRRFQLQVKPNSMVKSALQETFLVR